jgi:hypothetical protein
MLCSQRWICPYKYIIYSRDYNRLPPYVHRLKTLDLKKKNVSYSNL